MASAEASRAGGRTAGKWDPAQYRKFGGERARPFYDLIGQIGAEDPRLVVDVGCGPGELTASLTRRWPEADVLGIDSSAEMIREAELVLVAEPGSRLRFERLDAHDWVPARPVDVIVSNALLQWLPDREALMVRWAGQLAAGGWFAAQVPANHNQPSYRLLRELMESSRWRSRLEEVRLAFQAADPARYVDLLAGTVSLVDAWETTYLHVLPGEDPVLNWLKGTGLRPVLAALDEPERAEFEAEYGALLRDAYPRREYGTVLPFRRVFFVARK